MGTQPDHTPQAQHTDVVEYLELRADMCNCNGDLFCKACDDRHLAIAEIQRLRDTITNLRNRSTGALWQTRNVATALMNAYACWGRSGLPMGMATQPEAQHAAVAKYEADKATWTATDDIVNPPGWRFRNP